jgi:glycosyltransferase involved in cell wall biosynthesis
MKIAYVSREFGSITGGGIGTYIANVTQYMSSRGHEVYLVTDCFNKSNLHYLPSGVTLIPTEPALPDRQGCYFTWSQEYSDRVYQTLKNLSKKTKLDVIEFSEYGSEGFVTIRAKKLLNGLADTKLVVKLHTPQSLLRKINEEKHRTYQTDIDIYAEDYSVKNADIVTSPSLSLADYFKARIGITSIHKSPYPLELNTESKSRQFSNHQIRKVVFVGGVQVRKGVDFFIEAAKKVLEKEPNFTFEIYGRDTFSAPFTQSYTEYLQKRIPDELTSKILFKGCVPYEQIPNLFLNSCFCVFPSRWENWPNVCLEAMSLGCIVIGSKHGGMSEMITHGISGFLVDPYKPEEIAHTILDTYQNTSCLQQISETARSSIKQWCNPELACQQIESCYQIEVKPRQRIVNQEPKVSVIIPLYNQGQYLQEAIDSVKASTYKNLEIVVVNDGSTDTKTNQIFEQLEGVVKVAKRNGGLSSARNAGIRASSGDLVLPLDADDKIHSSFIMDAVQCLLNNKELHYVGCYSKYFGTESSVYIPVGFIDNVTFLINTEGSCTKLFHKTVFDTVGFYDEEMISYEDWDLVLRLNQSRFKGDILPDVYFYYRRKENSMLTLAFSKSGKLNSYMLKKNFNSLNSEELVNIAQLLIELWRDSETARWGFSGENSVIISNARILETRIAAMESSKFWKIRKQWIKLKRRLGLTQEEP